MSPRATPPLLKDLNERTVLETLRVGAPLSRAEISRRAGISKPTVSLALRSLVVAGLVRESPPAARRPSYGAVYFEPVPEAALVVGIDLGARFLRGAICDLAGNVRERRDLEIDGARAEPTLDAIVALRSALVASTGLPDRLVDSTVVGVPGVVEPDGETIKLADNVPGVAGVQFARELRARLGETLVVENDIDLAALGERWRGIARGVDDFAFLSIGTGLGAGLVLRGELHRGHNGAAGEVDFVRAGLGDAIDPAGVAITELAEELVGREGAASSLAPPLDPRAVFDAARAGDPLARRIAGEEARRIALHIAPIAAVADVELVVLGGGIGSNGDLLLGNVRSLLAEWLPYPPRVDVSTLGDAAVLMGALAVGLDSALDNVFVNRPRAARAG
jgi:predicted NBD/HSP70 family sugar kinase